MSQIDIELAALLSSLSFDPPVAHARGRMSIPLGSPDIEMGDEDRGYHSDSTDISTRSSSVAPSRPSPGPCAILHGFACYHSFGGEPHAIGDAELSQLVFSHREAFLACPSAHAGCSTGFKGLASVLEKRAQIEDGSVGMDVVGMLRTEAWLLSGWGA
ncbi:hypothetical protein F5148DRAFT_1285345 [Russula earlei]|uniref:Uncharacterized protein n=1 Tax=Russula earlei TaxID=71964 RepID=A0ACC0U6U3_9AGAM|nr:hypothetical protein F5148DRAFT_1285345 [Russula earlei]